MADDTTPSEDRLRQLEELVESLRPVILSTHSEHGLQGLSGLVGQYRNALKEVEELRAANEKQEGTALDELARRRRDRGADTSRQAGTGS